MTHGYPSEWEREGGGREGGGRDGGGRKEDGGEERRERQKRGGERRERGKIEHNFFKQSFVLSIMLHHPPCSVKVSGGVPKLTQLKVGCYITPLGHYTILVIKSSL